jgi:glycerophosphoryl diester phosphodiesterase
MADFSVTIDPDPRAAMKFWPYPRLFAHRGGGTLAPENTVEAFDVAIGHACGIEIDAMLAADGTIWLMHDESVDRTTNGSGWLAALGAGELMRLDAGARFGVKFAGTRVPTLAEAARRAIAAGLATNIEIKPARGMDDATGKAVAALAASLWRDVQPLPLLSSFSEPALLAARRAAPGLPRGLLVEALPDDWPERCRRVDACSLHVHTDFATRARIDAMHAAGLAVVLYTENDPRRARRRLEWGADSIVTDRPDRLARVLDAASGRHLPSRLFQPVQPS